MVISQTIANDSHFHCHRPYGTMSDEKIKKKGKTRESE
jgi:hypothetical protein